MIQAIAPRSPIQIHMFTAVPERVTTLTTAPIIASPIAAPQPIAISMPGSGLGAGGGRKRRRRARSVLATTPGYGTDKAPPVQYSLGLEAVPSATTALT